MSFGYYSCFFVWFQVLEGYKGFKGFIYIYMKFYYNLFEVGFEVDPKFILQPVSDDFHL